MELIDECINKIPALVARNFKSKTDVIICKVAFPNSAKHVVPRKGKKKEIRREKFTFDLQYMRCILGTIFPAMPASRSFLSLSI